MGLNLPEGLKWSDPLQTDDAKPLAEYIASIVRCNL